MAGTRRKDNKGRVLRSGESQRKDRLHEYDQCRHGCEEPAVSDGASGLDAEEWLKIKAFEGI